MSIDSMTVIECSKSVSRSTNGKPIVRQSPSLLAGDLYSWGNAVTSIIFSVHKLNQKDLYDLSQQQTVNSELSEKISHEFYLSLSKNSVSSFSF